MSLQCEHGMLCDDPDSFRCSSTASRKWGDYWFCEKHGKRHVSPRIRPTITRLPEEPSCPSCERTREIISSRINAAQCNQKWEVLDALKEIQEAVVP